MKRPLGILVICTALVLVAGCGDSESSAEDKTAAKAEAASARPDSASSSRSSRPALKVMRSRYGRMLFDGKGRALYLFTRERSSTSRCYGACARAWPPFFARRAPVARSGVDASLIGTTRRRDGRRQATYRGHPLYYYISDRAPGEVTCQDVTEFGGTWLVVSPRGRAIQ
jgi:predicted lipoprotein with Yx(FWY)xxD motif